MKPHASTAKEMRPVTRHVGSVLRQHREAKHLSLEEVAQRAGITAVALHNLETQKSSSKSDTYEGVAEALGVDYATVMLEARIRAERAGKNL